MSKDPNGQGVGSKAMMKSEIGLEIYLTIARALFPEENFGFFEMTDDDDLRGLGVSPQESLGEVGSAVHAASQKHQLPLQHG